MKKWRIYYGLREYARETGDPMLGIVEAESKEAAESQAGRFGLGNVPSAGYWAVEDTAPRCIAYRNDGYICQRAATVLDQQRGGMVCPAHAPRRP